MIKDWQNFRIRKWSDDEKVWLKGYSAVFEYIKQKALVLKNELWFDYEYGLDYQNLNSDTVSFWMREILDEFTFLELNEMIINTDNQKIEIILHLTFETGVEYNGTINLN